MSRRNIAWVVFILILVGINLFTSTLSPHADSDTNLHIDFFDVGQGDAELITTPHKQQILIDGGPDATILTRLGAAMPFNDHTIDLVIITHNHSDHITGINYVLDRYDVKKIWLSGAIHTTNDYIQLLQTIKTKGIPTEVVWKGKTDTIDGVVMTTLHPLSSAEGTRPADQHDATIVNRVCYHVVCFLMTGDINEGHEQAIIGAFTTPEEAQSQLAAQVLKVPHHGSSSGLALNFLNLINPQYAVIEVGVNNRYDHPAASIIQKLADKSVKTFRTDSDGTIHATTDGQTLSINAKK